METGKGLVRALIVRWLVAFLLLVAVTCVLYRYGFYNKQSVVIGAALVNILLIIFIVLRYRKAAVPGYSFLKATGIGSLFGTILTLCFAAWNIVYVTFIDPFVYLKDPGIEQLKQELKAEGLGDDMVMKTIGEMHHMLSPSLFFGITVLAGIGTTLFISFIVSILLKPKKTWQ